MYPPEIIHALKDALKTAYWYKSDLRLFLQACEVPHGVIATQAWHDPQEYKVKIVSKVIDDLIAQGDAGLGAMRRLIKGLLGIPSFRHLEVLEDGPSKVSNARQSVEHLRELVLAHDSELIVEKEARSVLQDKIVRAFDKRTEEIERLRARFFELVALDDPNKRGIYFEKFLYDLFLAHDLNPRGSFRIVGEQIDGAFEFESTQFLLEAKWVKNPLGSSEIGSFAQKVERKLNNTLGLFVSLNGFTGEGLQAIRGSRPCTILMDGQDLAIVLQGFLDLRELLKRKIRYAAQTGNPFFRASEAFRDEA